MYQNTIAPVRKSLITKMIYALPFSALCLLNRIFAQTSMLKTTKISIIIAQGLRAKRLCRNIRAIQTAHGLKRTTPMTNTTEKGLRCFTTITGLMAVHNLERQRRSVASGSDDIQKVGLPQ